MYTRVFGQRLFWKLGVAYLVLLLMVVAAVDTYVVRALRQEYLNTSFAQLEALSRLAQSQPLPVGDPFGIRKWTAWLAQSGTRVTVVASTGTVLADSDEEPGRMENHAGRPEIRAALAQGEGRAVRFSPTLGHELVYLAIRYPEQGDRPLIIRFSVPLERLDKALAGFRQRLWGASLIIFIVAGTASLLFFRTVSARIQNLKEFSRRVAAGNFRTLPPDRSRDELADLAGTLNQTAAQLDRTVRVLTEERNQSAAILASMAEGVAVIGSNHRLVYCNDAFREAVAMRTAAWENRPAVELISHSDLLSAIEKAVAGKETFRGEIIVGALRTRSFSITATPVSTNSTSGAVLVLHDITEIRRLERVRRDFVANVSHEFGTPLTAIQGFAETLLSGALDDQRNNRRFVEIIRDNAIRLERLTKDLLKLSRIEAGRLQLELRPVSADAVIRACVENARLKCDGKQLIVEIQCSPNLPPILGDMGCLQEIVDNLIDNAVRYSVTGGRITVSASEATDRTEIALSVSDTGIGIARSEQDRIFERFYRTDAARSRESGGTGLGLSIVKHLVEAQGGRIQVESELGRGSTFRAVLPAV
jgi:two-component system, OmpR family, phosphate regulon sensor histidine kinase PhoR